MIDLLGLSSLTVTGINETMSEIEIDADLAPGDCGKHPGAKIHRAGRMGPLLGVADTPMRGKPVTLNIRRHEYQCSVCKADVYSRGHDLDPDRAITARLVRFVEDALLSRSVSDVSLETGLGPNQIQKIATQLAGRMRTIAFPTPEIVAMDGVHCSRTRRFQIVTDGRSGLPLGMFEGLDFDKAATELPKILTNMAAIRVFVTDMDPVYKPLLGFMPNAIHVADKFHVVEKINTAVYGVVTDQIRILNARGRKDAADQLRWQRPALAGRRTAAEKADPQLAFDFEKLPRSVSKYKKVNDAHHARWQMLEFYRSPSRAIAIERLDELRRRASADSIAERMAEALTYLSNNEKEILAYFDALTPMPDGTTRGPTTNAAERRNGNVQQLWAQSRAFGSASESFWLKVMFHPYRLGRHIIECAACGKFEGPFDDGEAFKRGVGPVRLPHQQRCRECEAQNLPPRIKTRRAARADSAA